MKAFCQTISCCLLCLCCREGAFPDITCLLHSGVSRPLSMATAFCSCILVSWRYHTSLPVLSVEIFGSIHYKVFRYCVWRLVGTVENTLQAFDTMGWRQHSALLYWQPMILLLCKPLSNTMSKLFSLFSSSKYHGTMLVAIFDKDSHTSSWNKW